MAENSIDVRYVADLARLKLDESQIGKLQKDMEAILSYISELNELDVSNIEPTAHATKMTNVIREDEAGVPYGRVLLDNAPELVQSETIKLPRVLPGEGSN